MTESSMEQIPLSTLSRKQRRVLGVLLEKAFTTPEQYPLTLKATTTGCNQKNNRDPASNYDEDAVHQTLEELREIGFVGVLHTETGRTERYRHYMRHRTKLTEQQLAVMTELMLRGKQQLGELRTRASRMVPIETQEDLREVLQALAVLGLVRSNGPLDRRGIEVDHNLYPAGENREELSTYVDEPAPVAAVSRPTAAMMTPSTERPQAAAGDSSRTATLADEVEALRDEVRELRQKFDVMSDTIDDLRRQLGG